MIKISLENPGNDKLDFVKTVTPVVLKRVENLRLALNHILSPPAVPPPGITSYKVITRDAIKIIEDTKKLTGYSFIKRDYTKTLLSFNGGANKLSAINVSGVLKLLDKLTSGNGSLLEAMLLCDPWKLLKLNKAIMKKYALKAKEKKLLKLAFNYSRFSDVADVIRIFLITVILSGFALIAIWKKQGLLKWEVSVRYPDINWTIFSVRKNIHFWHTVFSILFLAERNAMEAI